MESKEAPRKRSLEELSTEELCTYAKYKKQLEHHTFAMLEQQKITEKISEKMANILMGGANEND